MFLKLKLLHDLQLNVQNGLKYGVVINRYYLRAKVSPCFKYYFYYILHQEIIYFYIIFYLYLDNYWSIVVSTSFIARILFLYLQ